MSKLQLWSENRAQCVASIFESISNASQNGPQYLSQHPSHGFHTCIIGGGISGILTALKLSRTGRIGESIALFETSPTLGGRLFFSIPQSHESSPAENFLRHVTNCRKGEASGFGFEALGNEAAIALERHVRSTLDEHEIVFLDNFLAENDANNETESGHSTTYFVRKEPIPLSNVLKDSTDLLTRKEAEILAGIMARKAASSEEEKTLFQDSAHWKSLSNPQRDALVPILETLVAKGVLEYANGTAQYHLQKFITESTEASHPPFRRAAGFELACELILRARGVQVFTSSRVTKLTSPRERVFDLTAVNSAKRQETKVSTTHVVIAAPLISCISFLPREFLSGSQSKCILKTPPSSLVVAEYFDFKKFQDTAFEAFLKAGDKLLFATDRVQGTLGQSGNLLLSSYLNYEESLQAAAVREAVGRIRRAAGRVLKADSLKSVAGQTLVHMNTGIRERLVLMPVARQFEIPSTPLREVKMGQKGLLCCGDNFTFDLVPWKNIAQSVQDVVTLLNKEFSP
jgi:hypothetical protein